MFAEFFLLSTLILLFLSIIRLSWLGLTKIARWVTALTRRWFGSKRCASSNELLSKVAPFPKTKFSPILFKRANSSKSLQNDRSISEESTAGFKLLHNSSSRKSFTSIRRYNRRAVQNNEGSKKADETPLKITRSVNEKPKPQHAVQNKKIDETLIKKTLRVRNEPLVNLTSPSKQPMRQTKLKNVVEDKFTLKSNKTSSIVTKLNKLDAEPKPQEPKAAKSTSNKYTTAKSKSEEPNLLKPISGDLKKITPKLKTWSRKNRNDLEAAFHLYNPCIDKDWEQIARALAVEWTADELKVQAQKMNLKSVSIIKNQTSKHDALDKIKKLTPKGRVPKKGTIQREELEEVVMQQLFVQRTENNENVPKSLDDSDDEFIEEAMRDHALDDNSRAHRLSNHSSNTPTSKRTYFPKSVNANRRRSSLEELEAVGDDFSIQDKDSDKFRHKYRAQQFNRRFGINKENKDGEELNSKECNLVDVENELNDEISS